MNSFLMLFLAASLGILAWSAFEYFQAFKEAGRKKTEDALSGKISSLESNVKTLHEKVLDFHALKEERAFNLRELNRINNKINSIRQKLGSLPVGWQNQSF